jgi:hypothetical protein
MTRFFIDIKRFCCDPIDREVIIMDTVSGRLFLLEQAAALLWESVVNGETREAILYNINSRYGPVKKKAAEDFLKHLIQLELVTEIFSDDENLSPKSTDQHWPEMIGEFLVTQYDDMTSIITMDPIHDIDVQRGWPFKSKN